MVGHMTGNTVRTIRSRFGMTAETFAQVVGVHIVTVFRWEAAGPNELPLEPRQLQILSLMHQQLEQKRSNETSELGKAIVGGIIAGGGLAGLFYLLREVFEPPPVRRSGGAARPPTTRKRRAKK
jgi:hypothetical protein